ncbi:ATP-binding cassette domain-containing protein [Endozoicomonas sp. YOMI1]|uniref:ATP-binding cassette domain-containing protein n=1 Tax=Endozoicomonas sp. YOMI1 TaxID=2828739 RepID=UPI002147D0C7|nr:ATP-binding cassette domain-containing protein [Endozoicomonas sp. YOMI1]
MADLKNHAIKVVGAEANNLRHLDVMFPIGAISMVVGVSGSGKSSLLSETLAREGNDRLNHFLGVKQDHLPPSTHQAFIGPMPASLHLGQKAFRASSRTTVGTASNILTLLRRMFVRWSQPIAQQTGEPVNVPTAEIYQQWIDQHHQGSVVIWAIPLSYVESDGVDMAKRMLTLGIDELIVRSETDSPKRWESGRKVSAKAFKPLAKQTRHLVEAYIGRINLTQAKQQHTLKSLLELAFEAGQGKVFVELPGGEVDALDSRQHWVTPGDPSLYSPPNDHLLSFNAPEHLQSGACEQCKGIGRCITLDIEALIPHPERSMHQGAFSLWTEKNYKYINIQHETIEGLRGIRGFDPDTPWSKLKKEARRVVLEGLGDELVTDLELGSRRKVSKPRRFLGFQSAILERIAKRGKTGEHLGYLVGEGPCPGCQGTRWSNAARALKINQYSIDELLTLSFTTLAELCKPASALAKGLPKEAQAYLHQIHHLALSFVGVGLGHLNAARGMTHISEGESRRLRLAASLDGRHRGLCLLLDEPARGLHDEDVDRLVTTLLKHRHAHTLILNEHRHRLAAAADFFVEIGPGAGPEGGTIVHAGKVPQRWWQAEVPFVRQPIPVKPRGPKLVLKGACIHNLNQIDVSIPLGHFVCLIGVSGSGKSSFVRGVLVPALSAHLNFTPDEFDLRRGRWSTLKGADKISGLVALDQRTPTVNRRSTVATFTGLAEPLRQHYSKQPLAKSMGLQAKDFGLNAGNGRCQQCLGIGELEEKGHWITCPGCGGSCFGQEVLAVRENELDIAQLLGLTISTLAATLPRALTFASTLLQAIDELGIGHLSLGRRLDTISGGELQRLRIAKELIKDNPQALMFVLDEPAAGLHRTDVSRLLHALERIVEKGHTVIVVEHNLELAAAADWLIEFGPGSGAEGGQVIANGTPQQVRQLDTPSGRMLSAHGKPVKPKSTGRTSHEKNTSPPALNEAQNSHRWLRRLLGDDIAPQEQDLYCEDSHLAVCVDKPPTGRLLEYGALECELAALMIECESTTGSKRFDAEHMVEIWSDHNEAELRIHPLIREIYTWGTLIPKSVQQSRYNKLTQEGFTMSQHQALCELRVTGAPFSIPHDASNEQRRHCIDFALLIGGGYVELYDGNEQLAIYATRGIDLERGIVGPLGGSALDFQRCSQRSRCPACQGTGNVRSYDEALILGNAKHPVEKNDFLHPKALSILKGVHRNVLLPLFRRLDKEGLWPKNTPIGKLSQAQRDILLFGYWSRPGHGSFLKNASDDPKEVASWLRWDGLFAHVHDNLARADNAWRKSIESSQQQIPCTLCSGSGLRAHTHLYHLAGKSYFEWLSTGTVKTLYHALMKLSPPNARAECRRNRLVDILAPVVRSRLSGTKLNQALNEFPWQTWLPEVVSAYTNMPTIIDETLK